MNEFLLGVFWGAVIGGIFSYAAHEWGGAKAERKAREDSRVREKLVDELRGELSAARMGKNVELQGKAREIEREWALHRALVSDIDRALAADKVRRAS